MPVGFTGMNGATSLTVTLPGSGLVNTDVSAQSFTVGITTGSASFSLDFCTSGVETFTVSGFRARLLGGGSVTTEPPASRPQVGKVIVHHRLRPAVDGEHSPVLLRLVGIGRTLPRFVERFEHVGQHFVLLRPA